ncbi:carbohydrate kinase family protein [Planctomycetales bacterium ZRK34]|nr:carbohydrate kinase family protein [Planctomycetales bacterium ZRK34]
MIKYPTDYPAVRKQTADALRAAADKVIASPIMVGFDGMVDTILAVVNKRRGPEDYEPISQMSEFGQKIVAAAGKSSNYEMVVKQVKLGGNGPIMANALCHIGLPVTYIGGIGHPELHPAYQPLADGCAECLPIADPGYTDAVEFDDGKLMFGKLNNTRLINPDAIRKHIGDDKLKAIFARSAVVSMVNWTMLAYTSDIWKYLLADILPDVKWENGQGRIFIDLTDPEKRTRDDLIEATQLISKMQEYADVTLGLNLKESEQVAAALDIATGSDPGAGIEATAEAIREKLEINTVLIHPLKSAAAARLEPDGSVVTAFSPAPYTKKPVLSTGAGDNFNAGCCIGWLAGLPLDQMLTVGNAVSGYYVRNAGSPTLDQLIDFVATMPDPEV